MAFKADCYVIRSGRHRTPKGIGARKRGPFEWAQYAIAFLHSQGLLPPTITGPELVQQVRLQLGVDPKYLKARTAQRWGRIGKELMNEKTIYSAAEVQGIVYRKVRRGRPRKIGS
jgi:hypothetical protein